jgi:hypothetical protein
MCRSKEMGKPVDELTPHELKSEHKRCSGMLARGCHPNIRKSLTKRVRDIEERMSEGSDR